MANFAPGSTEIAIFKYQKRIKSQMQCLQPYRNPTRNPGFFNKPNPNLTRNFETQIQPKPEFENLTQPGKTGFILGCFSKKNFQI
jgi:hypothetical protein